MEIKSIGAIIGDIIGSPYEFDNIKMKDFPLFSEYSCITDDSILTIATMQALMDGGSSEDFRRNYRLFGNKHDSSYGLRFYDWLKSDDPQAYNSWGNGSAMRVGPVAWFYDDLETVERVAEVSASVTHNHPLGIKGAQATASAVFLARTGKSKQEIKSYVETRYGYALNFTLDEIRPDFGFDESCEGTVPPAIVAFMESDGFEDAIRSAVSLGGDSDTIAAITGSIAETFYGVPVEISNEVSTYLPKELKNTLMAFNFKLLM